jgi:Sec-independent protein secretion pathway component TatC
LIPAVLFYDVVVWVHVMAVVIAFGGVFTYPIWLAMAQRAEPAQRAWFHQVQGIVGKYVISNGVIVIFAAGAYLATDRDLWSEVWVTVPLVILVGLFILGPTFFARKEERLRELAASGGGPEYDRIFVQVRNVSYAAMVAVAVAAYLMITKAGA